jgi:hypothetical protein
MGGGILMGFEKLIGLMICVFALGILAVVFTPQWGGPVVLEKTFALFGLSLLSVVLLLWISGFLYRRWIITGRKNKTTRLWAIGFALFSVIFIGLIFQSFGVSWANMNVPIIFFIFRQFMILALIPIYLGIVRIVTESKFFRLYLPSFMFLVSYIWFIYGLFILKNIEVTMYGFLLFAFVPITFLIAYFFFEFGQRENIFAMKLISFGFAFMGLTYIGWAPWHGNYFYYIMFFLFVLSLVIILMGFVYLSLSKKVEEDEKVVSKLNDEKKVITKEVVKPVEKSVVVVKKEVVRPVEKKVVQENGTGVKE